MKCTALTVLALFALTVISRARAAEDLDYHVADPELRLVRLDTAATESFLAVRADTAGRLFVGGREHLFVYEPNEQGGYRPRRSIYQFPPHTWVYDIAIRGDDLYVMTVSALYVLPGAVTQREGVMARRLIWGVPLGHVHQCFHGLAWGPEGDLYFSMGDPLWYYGDFSRPDHWGHWTFFSQPEGTRVPYTGVGGVFRCRPDGSHFQVVARGLRNSCGLCFDQHGNLFTNDNDHEGMPAAYVPGRLVHVTPYADFGWPRGWMPQKTPERADLLETMFDGLGRAVPVGQDFYDDDLLPARYRNNLLVARWCTRAVTRYPVRPRGASFQATEEIKLLEGRNQARPVGVCVGRGGRIFVTIAFMAHNEGSPVYKSELVMITRKDDPETHAFVAYHAPTATADKLLQELRSSSWSRRSAAQVELQRRGGDDGRRLLGTIPHDDPLVGPLLWLTAGQRNQSSEKLSLLKKLVVGRVPADTRLQAVRVLAESYPSQAQSILKAVLTDQRADVALAALVGMFRGADLPEEVITGPARSKDTYLRQTATLLIAAKVPLAKLVELCTATDDATRLAGVLAVGSRLTIPPVDKPLADDLPLDKWPAESVYVIQYADAKIDLRKLGRVGLFTVADHWKAGKHTLEQEQLFGLLRERLADVNEPVRLQAAHYLDLLNDPRTEPLVARVRKASDERRLAVATIKVVPKAWVAGPFVDGPGGLKTPHAPEGGPVDLGAHYESGGRKIEWREAKSTPHYDFVKLVGPCDHCSSYAYFRLESLTRQRALLLLGSDDGVKVWHNGKDVWSNPVSRGVLPTQDTVVLDLQAGGNDILVRVNNLEGESGLYLHYRALGNVQVQLPEKLNLATLAERLKSAPGTPLDPAFFKIDWTKAVAAGDSKKGRQLFGSLSCSKCHSVTADAPVEGGPSLADARRRFTVPYLAESIMLPSKQVSPVFKATFIETQKGQVVTGLVVSETGEKIELLLQDATRKPILKKDIAERRLLDTSPMPQGVVKTPEELRDLLAYLLSDKPLPP